MSGGGVRLSAYVGALAAFRDMGVSVGAVAGASAGSIVGALLAAGWPVDRMYAKLLDQFRRVQGSHPDGSSQRSVRHRHGSGRVPAVFFSRAATPDLKVSRAVRCSMTIPWVWRPQRWEKKLLVDGQLMPWIPAGLEMMQAARLASGGASRTVMLRLMSREPKDLAYKRYLFPWDFARILLDTMLIALGKPAGAGAPLAGYDPHPGGPRAHAPDEPEPR